MPLNLVWDNLVRKYSFLLAEHIEMQGGLVACGRMVSGGIRFTSGLLRARVLPAAVCGQGAVRSPREQLSPEGWCFPAACFTDPSRGFQPHPCCCSQLVTGEKQPY